MATGPAHGRDPATGGGMATRLTWFHRAAWLGLSLLVIRLADLQLLHGASFRASAERNRIRVIPRLAPRGLLLDRAGRQLATNHLAFRLAIIPQEAGPVEPVLARVSRLSNTSTAQQIGRAS